MIVGHPFDLVKVRLQTAEKGVYKGAIDVVKKTIAREGLARVWRTRNFWLRWDVDGLRCRGCMPACRRRWWA